MAKGLRMSVQLIHHGESARSTASLATSEPSPLLRVRGLVTEFDTYAGPLRAVSDVSFDLARGRVLAVLGESGSGKSAMLRTILGIQPRTARVSGEVVMEGVDLLALSPVERERI